MLPMDTSSLIPWAPSTTSQVYLEDFTISKGALKRLTFTEVAGFHLSPTIGVDTEVIKKHTKTTNNILKLGHSKSSESPLRPDVTNLELALIHASYNNLPIDVLGNMLNMTVHRVRALYESTKHIYNSSNNPLPTLPLITVTDTSRYYDVETQYNTYGTSDDDIPSKYNKHYKEYLRLLRGKARRLGFPSTKQQFNTSDSYKGVLKRISSLITLPEHVQEGYYELSNLLWANVSREEGISGVLSFNYGGSNNSINDSTQYYPESLKVLHNTKNVNKEELFAQYKFTSEDDIKTIEVDYMTNITVKKKLRVLNHNHIDGGYHEPLEVPQVIIQMAVKLYNTFLENGVTPQALELNVIYLLSRPMNTLKDLGLNSNIISSHRAHCSISNTSKYIIDTPPLVYPKFENNYGYGIICNHCNTFLSPDTKSRCKHVIIETRQLKGKVKGRLGKPAVFLYTINIPPTEFRYSLHYYRKTGGHITEVHTLDLLEFFTNFSLPLHRLPWEP